MEQIGRFQVTGEVGRGGEGVVYSAFDPTIGRKVAIKALLVGSEKASAALRARLRQEAMFSGKLSHPSIVTIHEFIEQDNGAYLVMEFVEGITLADRMAEPAAESTIISLLRQIADALDYAHSEGLVHRDVKPANMLVTSRGQLKVTDFGIAKLLNDTIAGNNTQTGFVRGTAHYLSPEQIEQKGISGQSDQFSLGVIAYQWLSGRKPFDGDSWTSLLYQVLHVTPEGVSRGKETDADVTEVLLKAMSKSPANRYPTCRDFINDLEAAIGVDPDTAVMPAHVPRTPTTTRKRTPSATSATLPAVSGSNSARSIGIGVGLAAMLAAGIGIWKYTSAPAQPSETKYTVPPPAPRETTAQTPDAQKTATVPQRTANEVNGKPSTSQRTANEVNGRPTDPQRTAIVKGRPVADQQKTASTKTQPVQPIEPPKPQNPVVETPVQDPPPTGRYLGPPAGRFTWTGTLGAGQSLTISVAGSVSRASIGSIEGRGVPYNLAVTVSAQPPEVRVIQRPTVGNGHQLVLRNTSSSEVRSITVQWREEKE